MYFYGLSSVFHCFQWEVVIELSNLRNQKLPNGPGWSLRACICRCAAGEAANHIPLHSIFFAASVTAAGERMGLKGTITLIRLSIHMLVWRNCQGNSFLLKVPPFLHSPRRDSVIFNFSVFTFCLLKLLILFFHFYHSILILGLLSYCLLLFCSNLLTGL